MFVWGMGGKGGPALTKTTVTGYPNKTSDPNKNQRVLSDPKKTFRNSLLSLLTARLLEYSSRNCLAALRLNQYKVVMPRLLLVEGISFVSLESCIVLRKKMSQPLFAACVVKNILPFI